MVIVTFHHTPFSEAESLPFPDALSIVSVSRSSSSGSINEGVNSLVNHHKSCPEGYELGKHWNRRKHIGI